MPKIKVQVSVVKVDIDDRRLWRQLALPGGTGGLGAFRDELCQAIADEGYLHSPVNNPLNALHRGGVVGTYKRSWNWRRQNVRAMWTVGGRAGNTAKHAVYLERGRSRSTKPQYFSWAVAGGEERWWVGKKDSPLKFTRSRRGRRILRDATRRALAQRARLCAQARANSPYRPLQLP